MDITGIGAVADLAKTVIGAIFPNKTEEEKAQIAAALALVQGQLDTNRAEATSPSMFVAGWRPMVGYVCASGFAVQFVIGPLGQWVSALAGHPVAFPSLDMGTLMPLLLGMLGLGGMRTYEKVSGINSGH
jgi:roadblock/LC7 domain-containing protein